MRAALAVFRLSPEVERNLQSMLDAIAAAAQAGADLVLFAETALTGLINNGDPAHDLPLGETIPGAATERIGDAARLHSVYVALGLFEREGDSLYDSAILVDPEGRISMKYRRMSKGWREPGWDASAYREGDAVVQVDTPHGSMAFLICGDLFDDDLCARIRELGVDYLLYPMAASFGDGSYDQTRWDTKARAQYADRAQLVGAPILLVNELSGFGHGADDSYGGAMLVSKDALVVAELPLGRPGLLIVDL